jgi:hypothetical protein
LNRTETITQPKSVDWTNLIFLSAVHLLGLGGIAWMIWGQFSWWTAGLALVYFAFRNPGITAI